MKVLMWPYWPNNPYQILLSQALKDEGLEIIHLSDKTLEALTKETTDVIHFHALYPLFLEPSRLKTWRRVAASLFQIALLKQKGRVIVWTAHDLKNHDNKQILVDRVFRFLFARLCDKIIVHSTEAKHQLSKTFKLSSKANISVIEHGHFIDYYSNEIKPENAREFLNIAANEFLFLFLGLIRPYKGIPQLLKSFKELIHQGNSVSANIIIAGKPCEEALLEEIHQMAKDVPSIKIHAKFVPDEEIQAHMNACDVVVLPYLDIFTSGSAVLAMSLAKPCITPNIGCMKDLIGEAGGYLYDAGNPEALKESMQTALENKQLLPEMGEKNYQKIKQMTWRHVAELTVNVYKSCK